MNIFPSLQIPAAWKLNGLQNIKLPLFHFPTPPPHWISSSRQALVGRWNHFHPMRSRTMASKFKSGEYNDKKRVLWRWSWLLTLSKTLNASLMSSSWFWSWTCPMIFGHYPKENPMFYKRLKYADWVRRCRLHTLILIICRNSGKSIVPVPSLSTTLIRS